VTTPETSTSVTRAVALEVGWATGRSSRRSRRLLAAAVLVGLAWSLWAAGLGRRPLVNGSGWPQALELVSAIGSPELAPAFLRVVAEAALVTVGYAVLGTALALLLGVTGGFVVSQTFWRSRTRGRARVGWGLTRIALALPRGLHEAVWALLLVNLLGLDPLVAVLAIGLPYGAITAKVYADLLDETPRAPYEALLAAGASRSQALLLGLLPLIGNDLLSYACYRLECSVRSAVVLGIVGAGGLGFQLDLSFAALRYDEMWTVIAALVVLCAAAEAAGSALRRRLGRSRPRSRGDHAGRLRPARDPAVLMAVAICLGGTVWSWVYLQVQPETLWSARTATQARLVATQAWPPAVDTGSLATLGRSAVETFQMSLLAAVLAAGAGLAVATVAARAPSAGVGRRSAGLLARLLLLLCRAVPPPVWALLVLFVLYPGLLPGAVALATYNAGVLGRLMADAQDSLPPGPAVLVRSSGAGRGGTWLYGVLPRVLGKDLAYGLYRWEVATRETVVVGLVGAGGLGQLLAFQTAGFDWPAVTATLLALIALTLVVDVLSALARRACR
jgi:phosphonate transport system permease protein